MVNVSIARRYARALLEAAGPQGDEVLSHLEALAAAVDGSAELTDVFTNPAHSHARRQAVLDKLMGLSGTVPPALTNMLKLMVDRGRMEHLSGIARLYRDLVDARLGRVRSKVVSAAPLQPEQLKKLEQSLKAVTQREVVLESSVDRSLLGGATAQVGSMVYDGSLKNQLQQLSRTLKG